MIRSVFLWLLFVLVCACLTHFALVLFAPKLAPETKLSRLQDEFRYHQLEASQGFYNLSLLQQEVPQGLQRYQDPLAQKRICFFSLDEQPWRIAARLEEAFWALSIHDAHGLVITSITNEASLNNNLDFVLANERSMAAINQGQVTIAANTIIAQSEENQGFAVLQVYAPFPFSGQRAQDSLMSAACSPEKLLPLISEDQQPALDQDLTIEAPLPRPALEPSKPDPLSAVPRIIKLDE
jgi:uncharacterized membrane protein